MQVKLSSPTGFARIRNGLLDLQNEVTARRRGWALGLDINTDLVIRIGRERG